MNTQSGYKYGKYSSVQRILFLELGAPGCHNMKSNQTLSIVYNWERQSHTVRFGAFLAIEYNEVLSGYQPSQVGEW
jgi:hypothetical protein